MFIVSVVASVVQNLKVFEIFQLLKRLDLSISHGNCFFFYPSFFVMLAFRWYFRLLFTKFASFIGIVHNVPFKSSQDRSAPVNMSGIF